MIERKWWTLIAVCAAIFMLLLDITIVNVALPDIQRELHASFSDLQWVIDAYALMLATLLLTAGSLADLFGRKRIFVGGLAAFVVASALCGSATDPLFLILSRAAQGIGGAIMFATSLALLSQEFHGRERGTAFGIWGATVGAAVAIGPLAGGVLTSTLGWRWIFFVNIPVGAAALLISVARLHESKNPEHSRLDPVGLVTFSGGIFLLIFGLVRGNEQGWSSPPIVACFAGSAALLFAFVAVEARRDRSMVDLGLFRRPSFVGAHLVAFSISAGIFAMFLYLTLYLQNILGYSALQTGLRFLPLSVLSFFVAPLSGKLSAGVPPRALLGLGLVLVTVSLMLMHGVSTTSGWLHLLPGFLVAGAGIGMTNPVLASTSIGVVRTERAGMASGINNTFRQLGIATGIAALGAVFEHHVRTRVEHVAEGAGLSHAQAAHLAAAASSGRLAEALRSVPAAARQTIAHAARAAFVGGLNDLFLIGAAIAAAGAVCGFALVRRRDFVSPAGPG